MAYNASGSRSSQSAYARFANYSGADVPTTSGGSTSSTSSGGSSPPPPNGDQPPGPTRVIEMTSDQLLELLSNPRHHYTREGQPTKIFVKVFTDWCTPCKTIKGSIDQLSMMPEHQDVLFVAVRGDAIEPSLAKYIKVGAVPVFFGFCAGRQVGLVPGADLPAIQEMLAALVSISPTARQVI